MNKWPVYHTNCNYIAAPNRSVARDVAGITVQEAREIGMTQVPQSEVDTVLLDDRGNQVTERGQSITLGILRDRSQKDRNPRIIAYEE